jgi:saccharopine dehydrogenase (NAD+, L-lysine-forming)
MTHLWVRSEQRDNEERVGIAPQGAAALIKSGITVTIEESTNRCISIQEYIDAGCQIAQEHSWPNAPLDTIIFGLKELPEEASPLPHKHIMFGHAFKDQPAGQRLLKRFKAGGGTLYDLEYLTEPSGKRVAAFGYWAGYAGAAVALKCWIAQQRGELAGPVQAYPSSSNLVAHLGQELETLDIALPTALIIGALGRVGSGAADLCAQMGVDVTKWDMAETESGGPFPQILAHSIFLNCILARPGTPVFVPKDAKTSARDLTVIGDIACDPDSDFSPIKVYDRTTTWQEPALRVHDLPALDVTAIDNLPSMLPLESSMDYADQLLSSLMKLENLKSDVWGRAEDIYLDKIGNLWSLTH